MLSDARGTSPVQLQVVACSLDRTPVLHQSFWRRNDSALFSKPEITMQGVQHGYDLLWSLVLRLNMRKAKKCDWLPKCHKGEVLSSFLPHRLSLYTLRGVQLDRIWLGRTWDTLDLRYFADVLNLLCAATYENWIRRRAGQFQRIWTFCSWGMLSFVYPLGIAGMAQASRISYVEVTQRSASDLDCSDGHTDEYAEVWHVFALWTYTPTHISFNILCM